MSQHDLTIDNQGFPAFRADLNNALQALGSTQSGTSAPSPTFANQLWYDTTNNQLKIRNEDNDAWITLLTLDQTSDSVSQLAAAIAVLSAGTSGAPALTTTGDTNTGIFFPAADTIAFAEGGAEAMRIDSSGRLLLGTTAVTTSSTQSGEIYSTGATGFMMTNSTAANYALAVKNEGTSGTRNLINFYEGASGGNPRANISLDGSNNFAFASTNATTFSTASTDRMRIDSSGNVGIGLTPTSRNNTRLQIVDGIGFPATQVASSDPNTLDDYEEGTFTPSLSDGTTSVAMTTNGSWYVKIGRFVMVYIEGYNTNYSAIGAGNALRITGLPFSGNFQSSFSTVGNTSASNPVVEVSGSAAFLYLANQAVDYTGATRNNLVGGSGTFSVRGTFMYRSND